MELNQEDIAKFSFANSVDENGDLVVAIGGEIDLSNVNALRTQLSVVLAKRPNRLVVDLSDLSFFDSSGIGLFVEIAKTVGSLVLRNPSPIIRRIIKGTGLSEVLRIES